MFELFDHLSHLSCLSSISIYIYIYIHCLPGMGHVIGLPNVPLKRIVDHLIFTLLVYLPIFELCSTGRGSECHAPTIYQLYGTIPGGTCVAAGARATSTAATVAPWTSQAGSEACVLWGTGML